MNSRIRNGLKFFLMAGMSMLILACQPEEETPSIYTGNVSVRSDLSLNSAAMGREMNYTIILPGSYNLEPDRSYPVLYLLHGLGDDNNAWIEKGLAKEIVQKAIKDSVVPEIVVVMPDALVTFYVNDYQDGLDYETYFQDEFIPYIESEYRILPHRGSHFIAGLSMGGYGASYHAFSYPGKFAYCYSMSGAVEGVGSPTTPSIVNLISGYNGNYEILPAYTLDCGTSDPLVYESNVRVHEQLLDLGFDHEYIERNGTHEWAFWQTSLQMALERIGQLSMNNY